MSVAHLLLRNGYGFSRVNKLAKRAFVDAAKSLDFGSNSKISIARIAALTGLTRIEVSQLLRSKESQSTLAYEPLNRAARVVHGWLTDDKYCTERGQPKRLPYTSSRSSFTNLVKKYSGDIPARAMLAEMKRLGMVQHSSDDTIQLARYRRDTSQLALSAMRAITPWVNFLSDFEKVGVETALTSDAQKLQLKFDSAPQVIAATREIENRRALFVESLRHLGTLVDGRTKHQLEVSVAVAIAASRPEAPTDRRRHRQNRAKYDQKN